MKKYINKSGLEFEVIKHLEGRKVVVRFLGTNSVVEAWGNNCAAGKVADPYHKARLGIGYLGEYNKKCPYHKRSHQLWTNMLKRCYDANDKRGYFGKGVEVCANWHSYAQFQKDLHSLPNFDKWLERANYELDKDILGNGKVYSKSTCQFIPASQNRSAGKLGKRKVNGSWVTIKG